jgi:C4-dicarboxylate-specific signal transduction histidine kinase
MATNSAVTERAFLTGARLKISRLQLEGDLDRLFQQIAEISSQALSVARVSVWMFDANFQTLTCKMLRDARGEQAPPPLSMSKHPHYLTAIREKRFVAVDDAQHEAPTSDLLDYLQTWNVSSLLDSAVYRNGQVVGIVCHEHVGPSRQWKREEAQFAATVADLLSYFLEVNERVQAEAQAHELELKLKDTQRLDALGRMAAGVAHDLNNLLGVITSGISVLQRGGDPEVLDAMDQSARHAALMVSRLMAFGRKQTPVAVVQPLDPILTELEGLMASQTRPGWRLASTAA